MQQIKNLVGESSVYTLSSIVTRFFSFIIIPLYADIFSVQEMGVVNLISVVFFLISIIVQFSFDSGALVLYYDNENNCPVNIFSTWFYTQLCKSILVSVVVFFLSTWLAKVWLGSEQYKDAILFAIVTLLLQTPVMVGTSYLRTTRKPRALLVYSFVSASLNCGFVLLFLKFFRLGISGVFAAQAVVALLGTLYMMLMLSGIFRPKMFSWVMLRRLYKLSMPIFPSSIALWLSNSSGALIIDALLNKQQVAYYQIANNFSSVFLIFASSFTQAFVPFALSIKGRSNSLQVYKKVFLIYTLLSFSGCILLSAFAGDIITALTNNRYRESQYAFIILMFNAILTGSNPMLSIALNIHQDTKPFFIAGFINAALSLSFFFLFLPILGIEGAAFGTLASNFISVLIIKYRSEARMPIFGKQYLYFISFFVLGAFCLLLPSLASFLKVALVLAYISIGLIAFHSKKKVLTLLN